ncbi:phage tail tape measure protein [Providencia rettgeri]|uniref:phage tail tape measure protein n=1 Tax=Providencia rettgeri TaxID=587 RepID=UPI001F041544|nr:phage tail tape measure protein [Providencia rettgeri]MCG9949205.1 phage tail tape measure protein [Providencia rettgeri]
MAEQTSRLAIILDSTGAKRNADTLATSLERLTEQGDKASGSTDELGFSFKRLAASAAGAMSIASVIKMADGWGQVAARMKNTLKSVEGDIKSYTDIQERLLVISNRNGKNIEDSQLLYIGAATSMQELGYNTTQTIDYIESLSSSMTANASSVNEVLSMQNALNKSMIAGKVAGENWNSIMNATPTLLGDIAKQLEKQNGGIKVTEMEVKKLAAEGKISFKLFADAVMAAKDANNALADSMDNTVADGFTRVTNSVKAYYGEMNQSLGITRSMSAGLASISDNFDEVATTLTALVGIGAARYVGNLTTSIYDNTKKLADNAIANRKLAVDKVNVARTTLIQAQNEKAVALAAVESTKAQQAAATTEVQRISLKTQLANQTAVLTAATKAEAVATDELAAAKNRANIASNLLKSSLNLIGGPLGAAMIAGGAIYYYWQQAEQAREKTRAFTDEIPNLISNLKKLNKIELDAASVKLIKNITQLKEDLATADEGIEKLKDTYERAQKVVDSGKGLSWDRQEAVEAAQKASDDLKLAYAERQANATKLSLAEESLVKINQQSTNVIAEQMQAARQQQDALDTLEPKVKILSDAQAFLAQKIGITTNAMKQFNAQSLLLNYGGDDANKFIQGLKQQVELSEKTGKARAQLAAEQAAMRSGANPEGIKEAIRLAGIEYDNLEKQRELTKSKNATYSESAAQKMLSSLKEQQMVLIQQRDTNGSLGSQQQALVKWEQQLADIKSKKTLTADQKSLLANAELITLEMKRNAEIEKTIQHREAEVKIASFHKQMMEEAEQAQKRYNHTIEMAGMGTLAQGRMQERFQIEAEFERKQADLQKQFQDKSTGMTKAMYDEETQFISSQLQVRLAMLEDFHVKQNAMRGNWTLGVHMALQNYADNARNYSQQAEGFITNSLQNITDGSADALTDIVTNSKNAFDAIGDFFGDLSKSIIKDLIRIAIQAQITNAITGLFGGIAGGSGAAAGAGASTSGTGAMGMSTSWRAYSSGGYTGSGNKYDPRGIVHAGEFVFTKEATDKIGKENLYHLMNTGEIPMDALKTDEYAKRAFHPAYQTNNTTNNSSTSNSNTESNENNSEQNVTYVINQTIQVYGNGEKALAEVVKVASARGAKAAVAEIQRDFATNGKTRKLLGQ